MKWQTLRHNGVAFSPPYDFRGLVVRIKNERVKLLPDQEEMLMAWAKKKDTPYVLDPVFQKNFLDDLKTKLDARFADISLADIDFTQLHTLADREKTANLSDDEKKKRSAERKAERDALKAKFGFATIDGIETEVGAYLVEPPGILMGRGAHPLRGKWKDRVQPNDVTLNLDEDAPVPEGDWKEIVHDHDSMWIATWYDKLSDKRKYVWLADSSHLRQERDKEKYLKAAKLEKNVEQVRDEIRKLMAFEDTRGRAALERDEHKTRAELKSREEKILRANAEDDHAARKKFEGARDKLLLELQPIEKRREKILAAEMKKRQLATVCYLIDRLAMRVGDEKDEDEADTVGASTLRVEHIHITADHLAFDFLGKDSVQWEKRLPLDEKEQPLARNLRDLSRGKQPGDQIFDQIDSTHVNQFLGGIVEGLTAKVFRTYHATHAVRAYLERAGDVTDATPGYRKEMIAKLANLEAAVVCNHKRTPPKNWAENLAKREIEVEKLRDAKPDVSKLVAQIPAREKTVAHLLATQPDSQTLEAQVKARQDALNKLRVAQADLPKLDAAIKTRQVALDKLIAEQKKAGASAEADTKKKQAALSALEKQKPPKAKKALAAYAKRLRAARRALAESKKQNGAKLKRLKDRVAAARHALDAASKTKRAKTKSVNARAKQAHVALKRAQDAFANEPQRYAERLAKAQAALEQAKLAPETAQKNFEERVERASLQLDLAKQTRDYNLGTSLKNYIDPRVFKSWGDYAGYDWKRLYTKALQRKFAWVEKERGKWKTKDEA